MIPYWQEIKEVASLLTSLIFLALVIAVIRFMIQGWRKTAHLTTYSERVVRVHGGLPYTLQVTVIPEFPIPGDLESGGFGGHAPGIIEPEVNVAPAA